MGRLIATLQTPHEFLCLTCQHLLANSHVHTSIHQGPRCPKCKKYVYGLGFYSDTTAQDYVSKYKRYTSG